MADAIGPSLEGMAAMFHAAGSTLLDCHQQLLGPWHQSNNQAENIHSGVTPSCLEPATIHAWHVIERTHVPLLLKDTAVIRHGTI